MIRRTGAGVLCLALCATAWLAQADDRRPQRDLAGSAEATSESPAAEPRSAGIREVDLGWRGASHPGPHVRKRVAVVLFRTETRPGIGAVLRADSATICFAASDEAEERLDETLDACRSEACPECDRAQIFRGIAIAVSRLANVAFHWRSSDVEAARRRALNACQKALVEYGVHGIDCEIVYAKEFPDFGQTRAFDGDAEPETR